MDIHDFDTAFTIWQWLEATDWRWDINRLLEQPELLMNDVAEIANLTGKMERIKDARAKEASDNSRAGKYGSVV